MKLNVVILAAGKGTRMKSALPKVLQPLAKKPLLAHVIENALALNPSRLIIIHGHGGGIVHERMTACFPDAPLCWVEQAEQLGTGHATAQAIPYLEDNARVLVLYGDVPLTSTVTLSAFLSAVQEDTLGVLTVNLANPTGYGRILRSGQGDVTGIVEEKDASVAQKAISEVNTGIMTAPASHLERWLPQLKTANAQGEYYLTDIVGLAASEGLAVHGCVITDPVEVEGVNDKRQLATLERLYQRRLAERLMIGGVTLADPHRIDVRGTLRCGADCFIDVGVVFEGTVVLGDNVQIGANCVIIDAVLGDNVQVKSHCVIEGAIVGSACDIGPYARLRPGTELGVAARIGNFVETKNTRLGDHSKANHLTYLGDCEIGKDVNVGAGTITCNYDGANKHKTRIGDGAFIGSNASLVAPIEIGAGATIGAGSTVTRRADPGALTVARAKQQTIAGWQRPVKKK